MQELIKVIAETFGEKESNIREDTEMKEIDTWDSLTHMELIANLESEFAIEFTADEIVEMVTVAKIRELVEAKINGN